MELDAMHAAPHPASSWRAPEKNEHSKALAAEALASISRLGQFGNFDTIGATQALQHAERVLVKSREISTFVFEEE